MKTLYLMRHAKSSWSKPVEDFDRGLNKRGKRDLPFMAKVLKSKSIEPDLILSSPAKRAKKTAKKVASELERKELLQYEQRIYEAGYGDLLKILHGLDDGVHSVLLVGHNPGLNMLAEYLSGRYIENIPTSAVLALEFKCNDWECVEKAQGSITMFEYPKKYL